MKKILASAAILASALLASPTMAETACSMTPTELYTLADNTIKVYSSGQGSWIYLGSGAANKSFSSLVALALVSGRAITVQYSASGVTCSTANERADVVGIHF